MQLAQNATLLSTHPRVGPEEDDTGRILRALLAAEKKRKAHFRR